MLVWQRMKNILTHLKFSIESITLILEVSTETYTRRTLRIEKIAKIIVVI